MLACLQVKQKESAPFYHRYIVQNDLFKYVFACFFANPADDMLKASVCHLMDFIGSENLKVLVKYIATQYGERLRVRMSAWCVLCSNAVPGLISCTVLSRSRRVRTARRPSCKFSESMKKTKTSSTIKTSFPRTALVYRYSVACSENYFIPMAVDKTCLLTDECGPDDVYGE